ncbi:MAG: tetratricopeptide repeat protein [Rhodothermales bacterium]
MHTFRRATTTITGLLVLLLGAGCASTQKRYDKAQDLENQGRYAEAVEYYVKVLAKEPDWPEARERLREAGALALDAYLDEAEAAQFEGHYEDALRTLNRLDALRFEAAGVGVTLIVPDTYATQRLTLIKKAYETLVLRGEHAEQAGDWQDALRAYERAGRYSPNAEAQADLAERRARVYLRWAEYDLDREYYQAGFGRAQHALDLVGPEHPLARQALDVQAFALEAGTRFVAFLPSWRSEAVARETTDALIRDLNDVLLYEHWAEPLPFIAAADPVQLRRELRRLRYDRTVITRRQATEIGRVVDADFVVVGDWTEFERKEKNVKDRTRKARMKGRAATVGGTQDTSYVEQRFTLELDAAVAYRIIDARTRREVDRGTVYAEVSARIKRGVFAGDYRALDLSGAELSLFEEEERLATDELHNELVDELAGRLAERVYDRLLRHIH